MSHNHLSVGLQLDEDDALVACEEDETSQCATRSLDWYENNGIDLEHDNFTDKL